MPARHDRPRFKRILDQAGYVLRSIDRPAGVFICLFQIDRGVRPQAKPARATTVVDYSLVFMQRRKRRADILLCVSPESAHTTDSSVAKQIAVVQQVQNPDRLQDLELRFVFLDEALDDGINQIPMAPVALHRKPVTEIRPHVIIKVMQPVQLVAGRTPLGKRLQSERLVREKEAEKGPLVLPEAPERADQNGQYRRMKRI